MCGTERRNCDNFEQAWTKLKYESMTKNFVQNENVPREVFLEIGFVTISRWFLKKEREPKWLFYYIGPMALIGRDLNSNDKGLNL